MTNLIKFSFTTGNRDMGAIGETLEVSKLGEVCEFLVNKCIAQSINTSKQDLARFIPSVFKGSRRTNEDFQQTQLLVLDVDDGDPTPFLENLTNQGFGFVLYETPSSTPTQPKYRIIVEIDRPITSVKEFKEMYHAMFDGALNYDLSCNDPSRLFYIPNNSKLDTFFFNEGRPIPIPTYKKEVEVEPSLEPQQEGIESFFLESGDIVEFKLSNILEYLKKNNLSITKTHQTWLAVCFACVSLKNHNVSKQRCLEYFIQFSKLDGEKCESQEKLIQKFEYCWGHTQNTFSVATIYFYAKEAGCPLPKVNPEIIKMVKAEEKGAYYLALNNTEADDIVPLYQDLYEPSVARAKIKITDSAIFALEKSEVVYYDEESESFKYREALPEFMARYIKQPKKICFLLGSDKGGKFYEKSTNTLLMANHYKINCKPVFHQDIHDWLKQLDVPIDWIYTYMYHVTDLNVALPLLHCWGENTSGKTFLCLLFASIWNTAPISDYIDENGGFKDTAGTSPIIMFEEEIPNRPNEIKTIVTSNMISIKQKYKTAIYVKGYSRVFTNVNDDILHFPAFKNSDNGALLRRIQPIKFTEENKAYMKKIGGRATTDSWLYKTFREHCAYIRANPQSFNLIKTSTDIIALSPIRTEHTDKQSFTFNKEHRVIQEYFYHESCRAKSQENKECMVDIDPFFKALLENRVITKRLSMQEIETILKKPLNGAKNVFRRDSINGKPRWRVNVDAVIGVLKDFGLNDEVVFMPKDKEHIIPLEGDIFK